MGLYKSVTEEGNAANPITSQGALDQRRREVFRNSPLSTGDPIYKASKEKIVSKFFMTHPYTQRKNEVVYVSSSNVVSAAYDSTTMVMMVEFRRYQRGVGKIAGGGSRYEYSGIAPSTWLNFKRAASKGKAVWVLRRRGQPYRKIR